MSHRTRTALIAAVFLLAGDAAAFAFQYPLPGPDNDPDFCSSRSEPVMFCVTPPGNAHCQALISEETPLYLGYRYSCDPAPLAPKAERAPGEERAP
jgi:hypothetical protein